MILRGCCCFAAAKAAKLEVRKSSAYVGRDLLVSARELSMRSFVQRFGSDSKWSRYSPESIACRVSIAVAV